jgi:ASC-1-like (ASCH) protein
MAQRPPELAAREMPIYKRYLDLIAAGRKTVEVRVAYSANKRLTAGQLLRFTCIYPADKEVLGVIAIEVQRV